MKEAWALRLKDESKEEGMVCDYYFLDDDETDWVTDNLQEATIYDDKDAEIESMKLHERIMLEKYGEDAVMNYGYTNMMKHFEFVEVELVDVE